MSQASAQLSTSSGPSELRGRTEPRLWTRPLVELTPETSYGYDVIAFARDVLGAPLDRWQEWLVIHGGELLPDGRPRFRTLLCLVARQNGKTHLLVVLSLYWLFVEYRSLILGTSTNLGYAKESWEKAVAMAEGVPDLAVEIGRVRRAAGEESLVTVDRCRYKIAASNRKGGRSLTIDRLVLDELREHDDWSAWNAAVPATNAVPGAQIWAITNQGDEKAVVLDSLRSSALSMLESGEGDPRLGIFEYSAPDGSDPLDLEALAMANPNLGYRIDVDSLLGAATRAKEKGGEELTGYLTEVMCMRVPILDTAIDGAKWAECADPGDMADLRSRIALCVDVAPESQHASLVAAAVLPDGRVRVEAVAAWSGPDAMQSLRKELPGYVRKVKPQVIGWFPSGPAAAIAADLAERPRSGWPPPGVTVEEIRAEVAAVCMGLAEQIHSGQIAHSDDPMLNLHVTGAEKLRQADAWRFTRRGAGHCDGAYAAAGAVHLARTLPPPPPKPMVLRGRRNSA